MMSSRVDKHVWCDVKECVQDGIDSLEYVGAVMLV